MQQHREYPRIHVDGSVTPRRADRVPGGIGGLVGTTCVAVLRAGLYETEVLELLDRIGSRRVGRCILSHLQQVGEDRGVAVMPASQFPLNDDHVTQDATWPTRRTDAYARGEYVPRSEHRGTGLGSPVKIGFEPTRPGQCSVLGPSDVILLHELIHAIRAITGTMQYVRMAGYTRFEGFVAVTITNVYQSELGLPLRAGHGCERMLVDLDGFRSVYRLELERLRRDRENADLYRQLGALPASVASWNPFSGWR